MAAAPLRILIINPNTSAEVTQRIHHLARAELDPRFEVRTVTASFGARYIASRTAAAIAAHAVLDTFAAALEAGARPDALIVGCFGDPGVEALREVTAVPVLGFAECGMEAAKERRFAIATSGEAWGDMLLELADRRGFGGRVAGVISLSEADNAPESAHALIVERAAELAVDSVVLGGAGLIATIDALMPMLPLTIIDAHRSTFRAVQFALENHHTFTVQRSAFGNGDFKGLSPALTAVLARSPI